MHTWLISTGIQAQTTDDGDMLMPMSTTEPEADYGSGESGIGSGASGSGMDLMPETILCSNPIQTLSVSLFDSISFALESFQCVLLVTPLLDTNTSEENEPSLLFIVTLPDSNKLYVPQDDPDPPFIDHFDVGVHFIAISACRGMGVSCDSTQIFVIGNVTISIDSYQRRLFPYGEVMDDEYFRNVLDGAVSIVVPNTIPFWSRYYHTLYVSLDYGCLECDNYLYIFVYVIPYRASLGEIS